MVLDVKEGRELALAAEPGSQNGRAEREPATEEGEKARRSERVEGGDTAGSLADRG